MSKPAHTCHAHCGRACPPRMLMCPTCWRIVPKALGDLVYEAFNAGKRAKTHPNGAWMLAADAAIALVHLATERPIHGRLLPGAMSYAIGMDGEVEAVAFAKRVIAASTGPVVEKLREAWALPAPEVTSR